MLLEIFLKKLSKALQRLECETVASDCIINNFLPVVQEILCGSEKSILLNLEHQKDKVIQTETSFITPGKPFLFY